MVQASLFDSAQDGEHLALTDASVSYYPDFYDKTTADTLFRILENETPWRQEQIIIAGLKRSQPRLSAWHGDANAHYTYSGLHLNPLPWSPALLRIKRDIELRIPSLLSSNFNSVLLNYYRDQQDSMGWHSDDEAELGPKPVIASLTLGCSRVFAMKHKSHKGLHYKISLVHGSLLIMSGDTQQHWLHAIAKEKEACQPRINLTFRTIFPLLAG
ncbi:alpha-ketoglutarate-dependent dioxygenase AlkB [Undibacterium seohonense]|uniref:Alpha-ketoglutarate-dependent dioxygenase AlkB n=1 Tax=Undibacterium seohonense TaxID=1344950 RepID=A0ABR6X371_9BURK|nr:alpha-ketoglutarate-dependent dioxygenase AlkB [Undibacterium seohonense]MBC3807354.1 alpha-ketoglutarate-dependent dioxygenase AlkB [Undibacterium seohonense]